MRTNIAPVHLPWMDAALCTETNPDLFFPDKSGNPNPAKRVCAACPVRVECLTYALETSQQRGIWGGLTITERRRLQKGRNHHEPDQR